MTQACPISPAVSSDFEDCSPESPVISSTDTDSSTSEDAIFSSSADSTGSSESSQSSATDRPSCSYDQPSSSSDKASSSHQPASSQEIIAEIQRKLTKKSEVSYNILLVAADVEHHIRSVCDIGQMLRKAGHYVTLAHVSRRRILALEYEVDFIEIGDALLHVLSNRPTDWICENLEKFHAQPKRFWANWSEDDKLELSRLSYEFNVVNRLFELKLNRLEKVYDLIIGNLETRYPYTYFTDLPFIPVTYMNPLSLHRHGPPPFSGYATYGNREQAKRYRRAQREVFKFLTANLRKWWRSVGIPSLNDDYWWVSEPKELGIYQYPEKLEYTNIGPKVSKKWFRIDPDCEKFETNKVFKLPKSVQFSPGKNIYINLGNLGHAEPEWMTRFLALLEPIPHGFIYAAGGRHVDAPRNVWTSRHLEDAAVIPMVDLVITHGGNNSLMQIIYHKKPMIIIPFFLDQYDNAQRIVECGIGRRLDTTNINAFTIQHAIKATLEDDSIPIRLAEISEQMKISDTRLKLRYKIEEICRAHRLQRRR